MLLSLLKDRCHDVLLLFFFVNAHEVAGPVVRLASSLIRIGSSLSCLFVFLGAGGNACIAAQLVGLSAVLAQLMEDAATALRSAIHSSICDGVWQPSISAGGRRYGGYPAV